MKIQQALQAILDAGLFTEQELEFIFAVQPGSYQKWLKGEAVPPPGVLRGMDEMLKEDHRWANARVLWEEAMDEELPANFRRYDPKDDKSDFPYYFLGVRLRQHLNRPVMNGIIRIFSLLDADVQARLLEEWGAQVRKEREKQDAV